MGLRKAELLKKRVVVHPKYNPAVIAKQLLEWVEDEESINFVGFCCLYGYLPSLIWRIEKENQEFSDAYTFAKMKLAERRERMLNENQLNYGAWLRYQRTYDPFLDRDETEREEKEAARKRGVVETDHKNLFLLAKIAAQGQITQKE